MSAADDTEPDLHETPSIPCRVLSPWAQEMPPCPEAGRGGMGGHRVPGGAAGTGRAELPLRPLLGLTPSVEHPSPSSRGAGGWWRQVWVRTLAVEEKKAALAPWDLK